MESMIVKDEEDKDLIEDGFKGKNLGMFKVWDRLSDKAKKILSMAPMNQQVKKDE